MHVNIVSVTSFSYFVLSELAFTLTLFVLFAALSDFQYLLADREPDGTYKAIHDQVYLTDLQSRTWLNEQKPLCLLPPLFSRFNHPVMYCYREPPTPRIAHEKTQSKLDPNVIGICMSIHSVQLLLYFCVVKMFFVGKFFSLQN